MKVASLPHFQILPGRTSQTTLAEKMDGFERSHPAARLIARPTLGAATLAGGSYLLTQHLDVGATRFLGCAGGVVVGGAAGALVAGFVGAKLAKTSDGFGQILGAQFGALVGGVVGAVAGGVLAHNLNPGAAAAVTMAAAAVVGGGAGFASAISPRH